MDECTMWEINDLIDNIPYLDRNLWESQRLGYYIQVQSGSKEKLKPSDICEFKWEKKEEVAEEKVIEISNSDIQRLKDLAKQWED